MYKVKANLSFVDKYTGKVYAKDEVIECEDARGEELLADARGLVEFVEKSEPQKTEKKTTRKRTTKKAE